jgi:hypothetical protein
VPVVDQVGAVVGPVVAPLVPVVDQVGAVVGPVVAPLAPVVAPLAPVLAPVVGALPGGGTPGGLPLPTGERQSQPAPSSPAGSSDRDHGSALVPGGGGGATPPAPPAAPAGGEQGTGLTPPLGSQVTRIPGQLGVERLESLANGGLGHGSGANGGPAGGLFSSLMHRLAGLDGFASIPAFAAAADGADSSPGGASPNAPPSPLPGPSGGSGFSGGSGVAFSTLFGLLVSLAAFSAQRFSRRLTLALPPWRPAAFIAVIERPG